MIRPFVTRALAAVLGLFLMGQALLAREMTVVVQRLDDGTELYISAAAEDLFDSFGTAQDVVPMTGPHVDFGAFFQGTWDVGDALLSQAELRIGGQDAGFEAMSFMLHPLTDVLPLRSRMDGMIAIGVCNTIRPGALYEMSDLQAYVGYYSEAASEGVTIEVLANATVSKDTTIQIYDIALSGRVNQYRQTVPAGAPLQVVMAPAPLAVASTQIVTLALALLAVFAVAWLSMPKVRAAIRH